MAVPNTQIEARSTIGTRIHVIGNSTSGKSTLAARLAEALDATFVELDAINWQPGWVGLNATDPDELERRIGEATRGERWVVAGSYTKFSQRTFWARSIPSSGSICRCRSLSGASCAVPGGAGDPWELIWGTNYERFWTHFMVWRPHDSLLGWIITQHARKRRDMIAYMSDPRWGHIRFVRLRSSREVEGFAGLMEDACE